MVKREQKRQQTLQLLLDTTRAIIEEKGCSKTTFSEIMDRSGLSKGAIFHYVKGKDDLLGLLLLSGMEETDQRFRETIESGRNDFQGPMEQIAAGLPGLTKAGDMTNQIFRYLLGRSEEPGVGAILAAYYDRTVGTSAAWIREGQTHGVIPSSIDAGKTAELFVLITLGLRLRSSIAEAAHALNAEDVAWFIRRTLQTEAKED